MYQGIWMQNDSRRSNPGWVTDNVSGQKPLVLGPSQSRFVFTDRPTREDSHFGARNDTCASKLSVIRISDQQLCFVGKRSVDAGVEHAMMKSAGITKDVKRWRTNVFGRFQESFYQRRSYLSFRFLWLLGI
ncbi:hypothetical protein FPOAC1_012823 [Fusarium poae]|uniref:hypothetical protein n=1 Tax=Fusarium poae TaxID=36050 RepID=UPI001CEA3B08|nr:hypothetical protein FPOAC1_012823 [Fusarium poae]KAG8667981.1 hypothetical protein FPOAC1_012823 [Fusarium poae]